MIFFRGVNLSSTVIIYDLHRFMTSSSSVHRFITNQFNDLLPVGLLAQLVERCTGFLFATAKVVYNCDDLLSYNFSLRSSHIWFSYILNFKQLHCLTSREKITIVTLPLSTYSFNRKLSSNKITALPEKLFANQIYLRHL